MPVPLQLPQDLAVPRSWEDAVASAGPHGRQREAVDYFRGVFGSSWSGWKQRCHLVRSFHTTFHGTEREWVRLHRLSRALGDIDNVQLLVKDLGSPAWQRHVAAQQGLEFCGRMRVAGHRVEVIRPTENKSPDVRVWLHERPVTIEFKALHDPDAQIPWDQFFEALHNELFRRRLGAEVFPFDIEFLDPALEHLHDVADALTAIATQRDTNVRDLPHGAGRARYVADAATPRELRYPVDQRHDLDRVVASLGAKYRRQLRTIDGPTLLIVLTKSMFFVRNGQLPAVAHRVAKTLQRSLVERTTISGLLLHEESLEPRHTAVLHIDDGWRFSMCATEGRSRTTLLVQNAVASAGLTAPELDVLVGDDVHW